MYEITIIIIPNDPPPGYDILQDKIQWGIKWHELTALGYCMQSSMLDNYDVRYFVSFETEAEAALFKLMYL